MPALLARYSKAIPAIIGVIAQVLALGILSGTALHDAQVALAALTALGVILAPKNAPAVVPPSIGTTGPPVGQ